MWLVALAAALWGTDGLLRTPLAGDLPAATVVFWEHLIIVAVLVPWLPRAARAFAAASPRDRVALVAIGAGASAVATALFTAAFAGGDPVTPLVLQKLQPLFAVLAAAALLGERVRASYVYFLLPALAGAWLLAFPDPTQVQLSTARTALLALGAAALWAGGTVLGRMVSLSMPARDVTVLRFAIGLPAAATVLLVVRAPVTVAPGDLPSLAALALIPGLLALGLYYVGLAATPAARATLAELAFPATAALLGVTVLGAQLSVTQWVGLAAVVATVTALGWHERRRRPAVEAAASGSGTQ